MLDHGDHRDDAAHVGAGRLFAVAPTLVQVTVAGPGLPEGAPAAFTARVVTVHRDGPVPTGTVAFRAGHRLLGTAPLDSSGTAVLDGVRLPAGVHAVVATYGGDLAHAAASSAPVPQAVVVAAAPVVVALGVPERGPEGVTLTAEILDAATGRVVEEAEGMVTFALDGGILGSAPLRGGEARLPLGDLPVGRISARFHGDAEHAAADSEIPAQGTG